MVKLLGWNMGDMKPDFSFLRNFCFDFVNHLWSDSFKNKACGIF